jgi:hypothetical protein
MYLLTEKVSPFCPGPRAVPGQQILFIALSFQPLLHNLSQFARRRIQSMNL